MNQSWSLSGQRVGRDFLSSFTLCPPPDNGREVKRSPLSAAEEPVQRKQKHIGDLIRSVRANLAKSYGWDRRQRQKGCEINKVWDPGVLSGVWVEECGLSNDQSTPSLLPWHLLVLQWPPVWVLAHCELDMQPESNQKADPAKLGSRSNSDILQNVNVQPFLKVLIPGSFALQIWRETGRGKSQRKK